jgi:hypothetical protein
MTTPCIRSRGTPETLKEYDGPTIYTTFGYIEGTRMWYAGVDADLVADVAGLRGAPTGRTVGRIAYGIANLPVGWGLEWDRVSPCTAASLEGASARDKWCGSGADEGDVMRWVTFGEWDGEQ